MVCFDWANKVPVEFLGSFLVHRNSQESWTFLRFIHFWFLKRVRDFCFLIKYPFKINNQWNIICILYFFGAWMECPSFIISNLENVVGTWWLHNVLFGGANFFQRCKLESNQTNPFFYIIWFQFENCGIQQKKPPPT